jgi:hypothetical protein
MPAESASMRLRSLLLSLGGCVWGTGVIAGFAAAERYAGTPGAPATPGASWPVTACIEHDEARPTLLLFLHPCCPCSSATVEELSHLLARCGDRLATTVLFVSDPLLGTDWRQGGLWTDVAALPGVTELEDAGGAQARLFGARTSGQAQLWGADGALLFSGGLTAARGHAGDNAGVSAVEELVLHGHGARSAPVFGCALVGAEVP